jgi:2-amino-4-hydroxy-6-hydroxymethyldihydropteridine diphosphokinase
MLCYIGVGSNLGNRASHIKKAFAELKKAKGITIKRSSSVYETEPQGGPKGQGDYLNLVLEIDSQLSPGDLLFELKEIEKRVGRKTRRTRWDAREIDLDILFCDNRIIKEKGLRIPHPRLHERFFVLKPLTDLNPGLVHPLLNLTVKEMLVSRFKKVPRKIYPDTEPLRRFLKKSACSVRDKFAQ